MDRPRYAAEHHHGDVLCLADRFSILYFDAVFSRGQSADGGDNQFANTMLYRQFSCIDVAAVLRAAITVKSVMCIERCNKYSAAQ